jgi:GntR family transcriptional regulator
MRAITRDRRVPLYYKLYEVLRANIVSGKWNPGHQLPSETELIQQFGVSRITARKALSELVNEGLIYREQGRGSFVSHPTVEQGLVRITSFTEDMRQRGFEPGTQVLESELLPARDELARKLEIEPGEELARLERLRLADGEPMSVEESFLVHRYCPGILNRDFARHSMREALLREYGIRLVQAKQVIRAVTAPRTLCKKLGLPFGSAVLFIELVTQSDLGVPVEYLRAHHRGDRYALYNELRG